MATLADLKQRILDETTRDDLADDLANALNGVIQRSIDQYENEAWWFNEVRLVIPCVIGNAYVAIPPAVIRIDTVRIIIGGVRYPLRLLPWDRIEEFYSVPQVGQPTDFAQVVDNLYLWPTPNQTYPLIWETISQVTPVLDFTMAPATQSNRWTNEGQDLITAQCKIRLYRDFLAANAQDPRIGQALAQEADAYANLRAQSNRRMSSGKVAAGW
jgi:hypothetical protein